MIICVCNAISDKEIKAWAELGGSGIEQLTAELGLGSCCGRCVDSAIQVLDACIGTATSGSSSAGGRIERGFATESRRLRS